MKNSPRDSGANETREDRQRRDESERRLRTVIDATPIPLFLTSAKDGRVLYANTKSEALTGLPPAELIGRKAREFYADPTTRDELVATIEKEGLISDRRLELQKINGERVTALLSIHPVIYENDLALLTSAVDVTERIRSEEALRESEERFRSAFEVAPHGIALVAPEGKWLKINDAVSKIIGYGEEELRGQTFQDALHPDDLEKYCAGVQRIETGAIATHQQEIRFLHKEGQAVWALLAVSMVTDSKNAPLYFVAQIYDLTERKQTEEALLESNRRLQGIFDYSPLLVSIKGVDGRYRITSKSYELCHGVKNEAIAGKTAAGRYAENPEVALLTEKEDRMVLETGEPLQGRIMTRIKGGEKRDFLVTKFLLRDAKGEPSEICGVGIEITEHRRAEEALLESNRRLQGIFDYSPLLISIKGVDGRYKRINKRYEAYSGMRSEEIAGKTIAGRYAESPEITRQTEEEDRTLLETGGPLQERITTRIMGGKKHDFLLTKFLLRDADGKPDEICGIAMEITERRRAEEALFESNRRLEGILNHAPLSVSLKDLEGRYKWINRRYEDLFGVQIEDMTGKTALEVFGKDPTLAPLAQHTFDKDLEAVGFDEPIYGESFKQLLPDGRLRDFQRTKFALRDENGQPTEICSISTDVTDRQAMEEALRESEAQLRESEERFRHIAERAPVPISINRISDGMFLYANPRTNAFHGFDPGELTGKKSVDLYEHPEDRVEIMKELLRTGHIHDREVKLRNPVDGTSLAALISYTRIPFDGEDAVMTATHDVSDLKRIETALRESEHRFRAVVEGSPLPLIIARTSDGEIIFANSHTGPAFGLPVEDVIGRCAQDFYQDPEERQAIMEHIHKEGDLLGQELRMKKADGSSMIVLLSCHLITLQGEETVLTGFQDITAFKEAEETFRQTMKMEAVGQLTGGIAHDFNNLLGVVIGNLELLEERIEGEMPLNFVKRALGAADRGAALTQRLLAFSRKQALEPKPTNLNRLVSGMTELLDHSLAKAIEIETDLGGDLWPIMIDPNQLESVILNLSLNAQDAMPEGGQLKITTENIASRDAGTKEIDLPHDRYVLLTVKDSGTGIAKENLDRVFDPFFTTKDVGKGSGLGLSVVYGFIRQSDGRIHIESAPGEGTAIKIYLPTTDEDADTDEDALPMMRGLEGKGETILVVEDDAEMRSVAKRMLTALNYQVLEAEDAPSALSLLEKSTGVDLLFSDVVLPSGMNGVDLVRKARQHHDGLKALLTSGYLAEFPGRADSSDLGAELIKKPYRKRALARKIREVLAASPDAA